MCCASCAWTCPSCPTCPIDLQVKVEPRLAFELNGAAFDNQGRSTPFAEGRASEFDIRFDALDLSPMWAYLPADTAGAAAAAAGWAPT